MFPNGFLGTRADMLMDIVMLSFIVILPILIWSWRLAGRLPLPPDSLRSHDQTV